MKIEIVSFGVSDPSPLFLVVYGAAVTCKKAWSRLCSLNCTKVVHKVSCVVVRIRYAWSWRLPQQLVGFSPKMSDLFRSDTGQLVQLVLHSRDGHGFVHTSTFEFECRKPKWSAGTLHQLHVLLSLPPTPGGDRDDHVVLGRQVVFLRNVGGLGG